MPKPMSLAEFRRTVKLKGQKSRLFSYKTEIFEALDMGMSLAHVVDFLSLHDIKISIPCLYRWVKTQKSTKPKTQIPSIPFLPKQECKEENISTIVQSPRVEPTEAPKNFDLSNDPKYARIWQVAQERTKMREDALKEKHNENHDS